jgi:hypothetical protein
LHYRDHYGPFPGSLAILKARPRERRS